MAGEVQVTKEDEGEKERIKRTKKNMKEAQNGRGRTGNKGRRRSEGEK